MPARCGTRRARLIWPRRILALAGQMRLTTCVREHQGRPHRVSDVDRPAHQETDLRTAGWSRATSSPPSATWRGSSRPAASRCAKRTGRSRSWALLRIRRGAEGGAFIAKFDHEPVRRSLSLVLGLGKTSHKEVTEARMLIEPPIARLAALRARPEDIAKLERVLIQEEEEVRRAAADSGTHRRQVPSRHRRLRAQCAAGRADERAGRSHRGIGVGPRRQGPCPAPPQELRVPPRDLRGDPRPRRRGGLHADGAARRRHPGPRRPHDEAGRAQRACAVRPRPRDGPDRARRQRPRR